MPFNIETAYLSDEEGDWLAAKFPRMGRSPDKWCPTCGKKNDCTYRWRGEVHKCNCRRQLKLHQHYLLAGIGVPYQRLDWDDYEGDPDKLDELVDYVNERDRYVDRGVGLILTGGYGLGKCAVLGTPANMADGTYKPVEELVAGDRVLGGTVEASGPNGVRPVFRVTTTWGHQFTVTGNHPVLVLGEGWVPAQHLRPGSQLELAEAWEPESADGSEPDELYRLLGYLVADGGLSQREVFWTKGNPLLVADFQRCAAVLGMEAVKRTEGRGCTTYVLRGATPEWRRRYLGAERSLSATKIVPPVVQRATNAKVAHFLAAYLESDGHGTEFYSVSETLLRGVHGLLSRLGIPARLSPKNGSYQGEPHHSWRLRVFSVGVDLVRRWNFVDESNKPAPGFSEPVSVPRGLCRCGCGSPTTPASKTDKRAGVVKGQPSAYVRGHHVRRRNADQAKENLCCFVESVEPAGEAQTWAVQVGPSRFLFLGDVLTHNTMLANLTLKSLVRRGYKCWATTFAQTVDMYTSSWYDLEEKQRFQRRFLQSDVLLLDDAGKELKGGKNTLPPATFDNILRSRVQAGRATLVTTNMNLTDLGEGYGAAVLSLLTEVSLLVEFDGADFRPQSRERTQRELDAGETRPIF